MGTFQKYPPWAWWVLGRQIVSELTMNSPWACWVSAPLPPVSFANRHSPYPSGTPTSPPQHMWFVRRYSICHSVLFLVLLFHHHHTISRLYDDPHDQFLPLPFPHTPFAFVLSCKLVICDLTRPSSPRAAYTSRLLCL